MQKLHFDAIALKKAIDHFAGLKAYKGGFIVPMISINYSGSENYEEQVTDKVGVEILIFPEQSTQPYIEYSCIYEQSHITVYLTSYDDSLEDYIRDIVQYLRKVGYFVTSYRSKSMLEYNIAQRTILKLEV